MDACTIVMVSRGDTAPVGNNEDWTYPFNKIWVVPATEKEYGRICFGFAFDLVGRFTSGGMNDQGLFIDGNGLPLSTGWKPIDGKPTFKGIVEDHILAHCASVEEAIQFFQENNVPNLKTGRFPIADKSGASVIVEWSNGKTQFLRKNGDYQISTNFVASNYQPGNYPCYRYKMAARILSKKNPCSIDTIREILSATRFLSSGSVTLFSNICDLKTGDIYIYNFHHFEDVVKINLHDELKKGKKSYYIPRLFSYIPFAQWNTVSDSTTKLLLGLLNSRGMEKVKESIPEMKILSQKTFDHDFTEAVLNNLGYKLMGKNRIKEAIKICKQNVTLYPNSSNAYDSLGEAYAMDNQFEHALKNYSRSVELNPGNQTGKKQIEPLRRYCHKKPIDL